ILFRMGRHEEALEHFNKVLDINPKDIRALINKRAVLLKMGREREAIECGRRIIRLRPEYTLKRIRFKGAR
ncbi:MAG: tetratricopeptide repeat protein, partial [Candidatus Diapherotrites archaeon]|nr:tetratricopeptide repeat protein [Candidatus Diapherotrites archaeon]